MDKKIGIIGAGAAGLVCGIIAGRKGAKVTIFEKNEKIGKKILATGNGRCNITNENIKLSNYHGKNPNFVSHLLEKFDFKKCQSFFHSIGLETVAGNGGKYFPMSLQAGSVVDLLVYECKSLGVTFRLGEEVEKISKEGKFEVLEEQFDTVVLACGGNSARKLGGSDLGYKLAKNFGHTILDTFPTLVQLLTEEKDFVHGNGVRFDGSVKVFINSAESEEATGDILITKYGLSGNAILDISRSASQALSEYGFVEVVVDMFPHLKREDLLNIFSRSLKSAKEKTLYLFLEGFINKKLITAIIKRSGVSKEMGKDLNRKDLNKIIHTIKNLKFTITGTKGFEFAEVSAGGVDTDEVNPKTFESKKLKDLYLVGELLDIDGDCGGYNLHFAWGSGYLAGENLI